MLNIEKYKAILEKYELSLDCDICRIRENVEEIKNCVRTRKTCYECRKENLYWLLSEAQILDDAEKRYLKGVIRPFRNEVLCIEKKPGSTFNEWISIEMKNNETISLPFFKKSSGMYEGMEENRAYTLEELGL